ncbi:MAG: 5-carboxymethyl-2-hydroxymuconate isomerase [Pseudomonadota bacterium]
MPHLIIQHTQKTASQMPDVCQAVFDAAAGCATFPDATAIKVRSVLCANHTGGTGDDFAHVTVRLLDGRSDTEKADVSAAIMVALDRHLPTTANLTVEIVDMHRASYQKRSL